MKVVNINVSHAAFTIKTCDRLVTSPPTISRYYAAVFTCLQWRGKSQLSVDFYFNVSNTGLDCAVFYVPANTV